MVLKLCSVAASSQSDGAYPSMAGLGLQLGLSSSEVHAAIGRARRSGLLHRQPPPQTGSRIKALSGDAPHGWNHAVRSLRPAQPNATAIREFLVHGLKYAFPVERGELTRGIPTSYAAPPLRALIASGQDPIPVWPFPEGAERGVTFEPLYRTVPFAAISDPLLYEFLVIADALRDGRVRERKIAQEQLRERLGRIRVE